MPDAPASRWTEAPPNGWQILCRNKVAMVSLVFVGACRANHIPARLLVGQCFKARESGGRLIVVSKGDSRLCAYNLESAGGSK